MFRRQRIFVVLALTLWLVGGPFAHVHASPVTDAGVQWLGSTQNADGFWGNAFGGTPPRDTTAVVEALWALNQTSPNYSRAVQWLVGTNPLTADYSSRRIVALAGTGNNLSAALTTLRAAQHTDGGWGLDPDHESNPLDAALALQALAAVGSSDGVAPTVNYLLAQQQTNGAWFDSEGDPSVQITAHVFRALWFYRNINASVPAALTKARDFLLSQRDASGSWGESFNTALALIALIPFLPDLFAITDSINSLQSAQLSNGSWGNDPYSTALALQALHLVSLPQTNPDFASIRGKVVDAQTGLPLSGVTVTLLGSASDTVATQSDGRFAFQKLPAGGFSLQVILSNYASLAVATAARLGQTVDLGVLAMVKPQGASTGTIKGVVTDAATGLPLAGVSISASGVAAPVLTNASGSYQISNVSPGAITVSASRSGYASVTSAAGLTAGGVLVFSPALAPGSGTTQTTAIEGTVNDGNTGLPLAGVFINVGGAAVASAFTDAQGHYRIEGLATGQVMLGAARSGYDSVITGGTLYFNSTLGFSPRLYPSGTTPANANTAALTGVVLDAGTNAPLGGVSIVGTFGTLTHTLVTDGQGRFLLDGLSVAEGNLRFTLASYVGAEISVALQPLMTLDLGQVRLRKGQVDTLMPDLTVTAVRRNNVVTDPNTLVVSGRIAADVSNIGTTGAASSVSVLAFYDTNRNGRYDSGDVVLGQAATSDQIAVGASTSVSIPIEGMLPFRDAPISVWVDSDQTQPEIREDNNVNSTASSCKPPPISGTLQPKLKWAWTGGTLLPAHRGVMTVPIVAPIEDTNEDGKLDQNDVPAVIFSTFASSNFTTDGVLRAVSGKDGRELWTATNPSFRTNPVGSIAVADLDGDGMVEIVAPRSGGGLLAFRHDGTFLWQTSSVINNEVIIGWGGPAIADLDADGKPEIIISRYVLNADGSLRWQGSGFRGFSFAGTLPIAVDIDLDGKLELIAGASASSSTGQLLWSNSAVGDGLVAVGNFNDDPYPEIVVVSSGRVFLVDHNGAIIWGPVSLPGGGSGGAPTVADVDGDGVPEIGVAGARNYTVFKADGSILWSAVTAGDGSGVTGSSVFDFDGDGTAEIVYNDETLLRIYRGRDGVVLFETRNTTGTAFELPVVADVDGDGHADIVVATNDYFIGGNSAGIRVYTDANNSWVATRKIWNQHSYHITNINDDGTVPRIEQNSWQTHNSYRLNAFPDRSRGGNPDLTASLLKVIDSGTGQPLSLSVRIGNAGAGASSPVTVAFYQGNPAAGGALLGSAAVASLAPGEYRDVRLDNLTLSSAADVFAVADSRNQVAECDETNNVTQATVAPSVALGRISVSTDTVSYAANTAVQLNAIVNNIGALPAAFTAELRVEDANGATVASFAPQTIGALSGGAAATVTNHWNTAATLAGIYRLRGVLSDAGGALIHQGVSTFLIRHSETDTRKVTLRLTTDRPVYNVTDLVNISSLVANVTANTLIEGAQLRIVIKDTAGTIIFPHDSLLGQLLPGLLRDLLLPQRLVNVAVGTYRIEGAVVDSATGMVLASAATQYNVIADPTKSLTGQVTVANPTINIGASQLCTYTVSNRVALALNAVELRLSTVNLTTGQTVETNTSVVSLAPLGTQTIIRSINTSAFTPGDFACALEVRDGASFRPLGFATFKAVQPPIRIDATMKLGAQGRLLILLDSATRDCRDGDDHSDHNHNGSASSWRGLLGTILRGTNSESSDHGEDCNKNDDPHGPKGVPTLSAQRSFLESLLTQAGWSYTIVEDAERFTRELRSGTYMAYALLAEQVKLSEPTQKELREAIFRGEGLIVAGAHDSRHHKLNDALGLKPIGRLSNADSVELPSGPLDTEGVIVLIEGDRIQRIKRTSAQMLATYRLRGPSYSGAADCRDEDEEDNDQSKQSPSPSHDECEGAPDRYIDAITLNPYGAGQALFAGFDLLAQATKDGSNSLAAKALLSALKLTHPTPINPQLGAILPIELTLKNQGIAASTSVTVSLPRDISMVDAGGGNLQSTATGQTLTWAVTLAVSEERKLLFSIRLPIAAASFTLRADISAGGRLITHTELALTTEPVATLEQLLARARTLAAARPEFTKALREAADDLDKAVKARNLDKAVEYVLKATDELLGFSDPGIILLRQDLDRWLRYTLGLMG